MNRGIRVISDTFDVFVSQDTFYLIITKMDIVNISETKTLLSAQDHPLVFNEQRGNTLTTGRAVPAPQNSNLHRKIVAFTDSGNIKED